LYRWEYIVCGPKLVKEVGNTPESVLSFYAGVEEVRADLFFPCMSLKSCTDRPRYYFIVGKRTGNSQNLGEGSYTLGRTIAQNPYHQLTVRTTLTRNLHTRFPDVRDEIVCAFGDALPLQGSGTALPK
jgi:hypothetical protein